MCRIPRNQPWNGYQLWWLMQIPRLRSGRCVAKRWLDTARYHAPVFLHRSIYLYIYNSIYNDLIISKQLTLATCRPAGSAWTVSGLGRFGSKYLPSMLQMLLPGACWDDWSLSNFGVRGSWLGISRKGKPWERESVSTGNFPWKAPGCPRLHPAQLIRLPQVLPQQRPWAPQQPQQPLQLPRLQQPQPPQQRFPERY